MPPVVSGIRTRGSWATLQNESLPPSSTVVVGGNSARAHVADKGREAETPADAASEVKDQAITTL